MDGFPKINNMNTQHQVKKKVHGRIYLDDGDYHLLLLDVVYAQKQRERGKQFNHYELSGGIKLWPYSYQNFKIEAVIYCAAECLFYNSQIN